MTQFSDEQIAEFEALNFKRRVLFIEKPELLRIMRGEQATEVYDTPGEIKSLRERGILEVKYRWGGKYLALTREAEELLISGEEL